MRFKLTLAAMLIGLSATAQENSVDDKFMSFDTTELNTSRLDSLNSLYITNRTAIFYTSIDTIAYRVRHEYPIDATEDTITHVVVNTTLSYKFACNGTQGYILHHDIPIYEFDILGKLEVEKVN